MALRLPILDKSTYVKGIIAFLFFDSGGLEIMNCECTYTTVLHVSIYFPQPSVLSVSISMTWVIYTSVKALDNMTFFTLSLEITLNNTHSLYNFEQNNSRCMTFFSYYFRLGSFANTIICKTTTGYFLILRLDYSHSWNGSLISVG